MRELRLWAAAAAGPAVAAAFSAVAALRRKRSLHPTGVGYQGVLRVLAEASARPDIPLFRAGAAHPALLRFSRGAGLPEPLPDPRWPRLGPAARTNQIRGVLAAPVTLGDRTVGTCNALTTSPRAWTDSDIGAIWAYAAMLGQLIGSASAARHNGELAAQLHFALESRVLIEQAKGVLMERHCLDDQAAFTRLRRMARSSSRKLLEVAREVIGDRNR